MLTLTIPPRRGPIARLALIGSVACAAYLTYAMWDIPSPPTAWPDITDPIGQLQYAVVILALVAVALVGTLRRITRQLTATAPRAVPAPAVRVRLKCQLCGHTAREGARLEVDHKLAVANGGTNDLANLWTLCQACNNGKSDSLL